MKIGSMLVAALATLLALAAPSAFAQTVPTLKAGAARVDVTPAGKPPQGFEGILDRLFARAIVVENGTTRAALVTVDAVVLSSETWRNVTARSERELGLPAAHVVMTATHTHSSPFFRGRAIEDKVFEAIKRAAARVAPARIAFGTGVSHINVNRNMIDRTTRRWQEGANYDGPSDKTVAVVRFENAAGKPIAVYYNYAVHAVLAGTLDLVSGDIPGAASRYIEDSMGDDVVAVWSTGAAGDQNPLYFQQTYDLRQIRIDDFAGRGQDISNAMLPGGQGLNKKDPKVALLMNQQKQMILTMGQMLGEEVLHVNRSGLERPIASDLIAGAQKTVQCPGRKRTDAGRAGSPGTYVDADPIELRLSMLRLGDIVIGGVDAEVFTLIAQRFMRESPVKHSIFASLTNGTAGSGYVPNDAAFAFNTFEVLGSRLKPGCAETAIVDGLLDLMQGSTPRP